MTAKRTRSSSGTARSSEDFEERFKDNQALAFPKPIRYLNPEFLAFIRKQPCVLRGILGHRCYGSVQACHIKTRGSGGWDDQVFPGCATAHAEQEGRWRTAKFEKKYGVDLKETARMYWQRFLKGQ